MAQLLPQVREQANPFTPFTTSKSKGQTLQGREALHNTHSHPSEECITRLHECQEVSVVRADGHPDAAESVTVAATTFAATVKLHDTLTVQNTRRKTAVLLSFHSGTRSTQHSHDQTAITHDSRQSSARWVAPWDTSGKKAAIDPTQATIPTASHKHRTAVAQRAQSMICGVDQTPRVATYAHTESAAGYE